MNILNSIFSETKHDRDQADVQHILSWHIHDKWTIVTFPRVNISYYTLQYVV